MNFINRALRNVVRKISKSIILMLTFFVIGNFVVIGLGVSDASSKAKVLTRQKMRAVINYEVNFMKWFQSVKDDDYSNFPYITEEEIEAIKQDSRVKSINAITTNLAYAGSFESISIDNKKEKEMNASSESENCSIDEEGNRICEKSSKGYKEADLKVQANAYPDMIEFIDNIYTLKEGNMFTADDIAQGRHVALITDTLAQHNQIRVGDTITIMFDSKENLSNTGSYLYKANITEEDVTLELEVIGIFDNTSEIGPNLPNFDWMSRHESPENILIVPDKPINELRFNMSIKLWDWMVENEPNEFTRNPNNRPTKDSIAKKASITILLHDPMLVDEFVEEYKNNLPEDSFIQLDANNETFQKLAKPLDTLSLYASFIVWLVV
ncbi:MAG: ABC transporter permease, partial [Erysipelotrichaceae bacterium]|nr:ABC transporter permease [Erysipelotrichaceae bacterium]